MDPVTALRQIAYYKDRSRQDPKRVMAYRKAADIIEGLDDAARERHGQANSWQSLPGIGPKTAKVIAQAWAGREPDALIELRSTAEDLGGGEVRAALRGDLHLHSNWSDGSAPIDEMMATAAALGHEYCALTDHSPRLTIANGLSPERLREQLDVIDGLRDKFAPMRILTGIEVDILEDGSLDQESELLERLDVVVASVHSKLSMDADAMTRRMVRAVSNPHADVLGRGIAPLAQVADDADQTQLVMDGPPSSWDQLDDELLTASGNRKGRMGLPLQRLIGDPHAVNARELRHLVQEPPIMLS